MAVVAVPTRTRERATHPSRVVLRTLVLLLAVGLLSLVEISLLAAARAMPAVGETMYPEGWMVYSIIRVRDGDVLYGDYQRAPFIHALYTPIYYHLVGLAARVGQLDVDGTVLLARGLSALATACAAGAIFGLARRAGASGVGALVAVRIFLSSHVLHPWGYTARPDALALALSLSGFRIAVRWSGWRSGALVGLVLAAAFFSKQSTVAVVVTLVLWLIWSRRLVRASVLGAAWGGCVVGGMIALQLATSGSFAANALLPNVLPMEPRLALGQLLGFVQLALPALALAVVGWRDEAPARRDEPLVAVRLYALVALGLATFALLKAGSSYNHLLEVVVALSLLAGRGFDWLRASAGWGPSRVLMPSRRAGLTGAVAAICLVGFVLPGWLLLSYVGGPPDVAPLVEALRRTPGEVLTERQSLAVLRAGKTPIAADPFGVGLLARAGRWDPAPLNRMIEQHELALVVLDGPADHPKAFDGFAWWPPGTRELIAQHYRLIDRVGRHYLYAPAVEAVPPIPAR